MRRVTLVMREARGAPAIRERMERQVMVVLGVVLVIPELRVTLETLAQPGTLALVGRRVTPGLVALGAQQTLGQTLHRALGAYP